MTIGETITLENGCVIAALRDLLDDPTWGPYSLFKLIQHHNGLPAEMTHMLEIYAPVQVCQQGTDIECYPLAQQIVVAGRVLGADEKLAVSRQTGPKRAHMECLTVATFLEQNIREVIALVVRKESEANG